jgi:8-oxo-dGTP diphosphatase
MLELCESIASATSSQSELNLVTKPNQLKRSLRTTPRMAERIAKQIGIAIVEFDGHYLVGMRQPGQDLAGLAEFPGGKCEIGERPEDCAVRECLEETGLTVASVRLLGQKTHEYAHAAVDLYFWLCQVESCRPEAVSDESPPTMPHPKNGFQWKSVDELRKLSFPEANVGILKMLVQ